MSTQLLTPLRLQSCQLSECTEFVDSHSIILPIWYDDNMIDCGNEDGMGNFFIGMGTKL